MTADGRAFTCNFSADARGRPCPNCGGPAARHRQPIRTPATAARAQRAKRRAHKSGFTNAGAAMRSVAAAAVAAAPNASNLIAAGRRGHTIEVLRRSRLLGLAHRRGKRIDIGVFVLLADRAHQHGWASAKTGWLADQLGCSKSKATRALTRLEAGGLIRRDEQHFWRWRFPEQPGEAAQCALGRGQWAICKSLMLAYALGVIPRIEPLLHLLRVVARQTLAARETQRGGLLAVLQARCGAEWSALRRYLRRAVGGKPVRRAARTLPRVWEFSMARLLGGKAAQTAARMVREGAAESLAKLLRDAAAQLRLHGLPAPA